MEDGLAAGWPLGAASIVAGFWVALWFLGRPLLRLLKIIGGFLKRIGGAIQRFLQPVFEFLFRTSYTLIQAAMAGLLGFVAIVPVLQGQEGDLLSQGEAAGASLVMVGMTFLVFRHFLKFPLRKGDAQAGLQAVSDIDTEELDADFDLEF